MLFLVLISLLALSATRTASFETRTSHSLRDLHIAFQATESALGGGEAWIGQQTARLPAEPASSGCTAPCDIWELDAKGEFPDTGVKDATWWQTHGRLPAETIDEVSTQPRFLIEEQRFVPDSLTVGVGMPSGTMYYRVTARGTGGTDDAEVLIQSSYVRRY